MTHSAPDTREQASAQLPALHLLCNLGWRYLSTAQCLALRGSNVSVTVFCYVLSLFWCLCILLNRKFGLVVGE